MQIIESQNRVKNIYDVESNSTNRNQEMHKLENLGIFGNSVMNNTITEGFRYDITATFGPDILESASSVEQNY